MAMIIGGAVGNLIDRLAYGYVIDYFDVYAVNFAIFNIADCFITAGAVIFCACLLFDKKIKL
jgi:signal peptidase II